MKRPSFAKYVESVDRSKEVEPLDEIFGFFRRKSTVDKERQDVTSQKHGAAVEDALPQFIKIINAIGAFPEDQKGKVDAFLKNPEASLAKYDPKGLRHMPVAGGEAMGHIVKAVQALKVEKDKYLKATEAYKLASGNYKKTLVKLISEIKTAYTKQGKTKAAGDDMLFKPGTGANLAHPEVQAKRSAWTGRHS
jgi:hypothetical protein